MTIPLQLRGSASATTEALASIFTPVRARISAIQLVTSPVATNAGDAEIMCELSFQSTSQLNVNDASGVLIAAHSSIAFGTEVGQQQLAMVFNIENVEIMWEQGQRIYLHVEFLSGSVVHRMKALIYTNR